VFYRLATLTLAQVLDLATFVLMVRTHGVASEANPLVADLFAALGEPAVVIAKALLIVAIGALCLAAAASSRTQSWRIVGGLPIAIAIALGLIGGITNTAAFLG
jgi:hypothetical protein